MIYVHIPLFKSYVYVFFKKNSSNDRLVQISQANRLIDSRKILRCSSLMYKFSHIKRSPGLCKLDLSV